MYLVDQDSPNNSNVLHVDAVHLFSSETPNGYQLVLGHPPREQPLHLSRRFTKEISNKRARLEPRSATEQTNLRALVEKASLDASESILCAKGSKHLYSNAFVIVNDSAKKIKWCDILHSEENAAYQLDLMYQAFAQRERGGCEDTSETKEDLSRILMVTESHSALRQLIPSSMSISGNLILSMVSTSHWLQMDENQMDEKRFYLPPRSGFLLTNLLRSKHIPPRGWDQILEHASTHPPSLVLLDPPYPNYSAKRLKKSREAYETLNDLYDLWSLAKPVSCLLDCDERQDCLVACWVTNDPKAQRFVLDKLFPAWKLEHIGQVIWMKTTVNHDLLFPLENTQGRKPFEILLLGRRHFAPPMKMKTTTFTSTSIGHSRKPPVLEVLRPWLTSSKINVYELFARMLMTGPRGGSWISMGNEPCTFNEEGMGVARR